MIDLVIDHPERVWELILEILRIDDSEEIIKAVGAGPLEDLMVHHGDHFIDKIEHEAANSKSLIIAMQNVWLDSDDTAFCSRFYDIAGIQQPFPK
ncbi:MAG: hypothetical protein KZQ76_03050 [Candidatus Thiodiazotropha sp. (ex Epidulcina cf. delphinae)]|nr:hypothetical protein [Candidatus Thiodiazotropha sp. (ex Epidulcina cf. delphinae)]